MFIISGIIAALLAATVVALVIITLGKLIDILLGVKEEYGTTVLAGDVRDIIGKVLDENIDAANTIDLQGLRDKAGTKGMFTAAVKGGTVVRESLRLVSSDQRDEETENLMRENNGLALFS